MCQGLSGVRDLGPWTLSTVVTAPWKHRGAGPRGGTPQPSFAQQQHSCSLFARHSGRGLCARQRSRGTHSLGRPGASLPHCSELCRQKRGASEACIAGLREVNAEMQAVLSTQGLVFVGAEWKLAVTMTVTVVPGVVTMVVLVVMIMGWWR